MKKSGDYWKERFLQLEEAQNNSSVFKAQEIQEQFERAQAAINGKINAWYQRFAANNGISMAEARRMLSEKELKEFQWKVEDYIKHGEENAVNHAWEKQLENASARVHISRLEALKLEVQQELEKMYGNYLDSVDRHIKDIYESDFYHTAYEIQKGIGVGSSLQKLDQNLVEKIVSKPWAVDGKNFSDRIWENKTKLINQVHNSLSVMCITGDAPDRAISEIAKTMNVSRQQAGRLVMTESAAFANRAREDCMKNLGVEEFEVVETLDSITCEYCQSMDGKHFPMKEFQIGVTAPPFHPFCRGCTCPYFDDEFAAGEERAARGEDGKTYYVPSDMTYNEWRNKFVSEKENQKNNANKDTLINKKYIDSKEYHNLFGMLTENHAVNETIYKCAKIMLKHRSGTLYEDIYFIDKNTGKVIASSTEINIESAVGYNKEIKRALREYDMSQIIAIHNHPSSMPPSAGDFNSALKNGYYKCFTIGHDGNIIEYGKGDKYINIEEYNLRLALERGNKTEYDAQITVLNYLKKMFGIKYKEIAHGKG